MQILAFIQEGRVIQTSLITQNPAAGFYPAGTTEFFELETPILTPQSAITPAQTPIQTATAPNPHNNQLQPAPIYNPQTEDPSPNAAVYLIMAEINSEQKMRFLHLIQKLGTAQRIGDSVWLLKTKIEIYPLKSQIAATLSRQDRLFILDSFNNKTAWHNIGADMGERIDELWQNQN